MAKKTANTQTLRGNERASMSAKVSRAAHQKISALAPRSSREIIDLWFYHYYEDERPTGAPQTIAESTKTDMRKSPEERLAIEKTKDGFKLDLSFIQQFVPAELINFIYDNYKNEFQRALQRNPRYIKVSLNKPPNAIIDAAILSQFSSRGMQYVRDVGKQNNPKYPWDTADVNLVGRKDLILWVRNELEKPIAGPSWSKFHPIWFDNKGSFEKTIDNRIKSLMYNKILTNGIGLESKDPDDFANVMTFSAFEDELPHDTKIIGLDEAIAEGKDITQELLDELDVELLTPEQEQENEAYRRGTYRLIREVSVDEWAMIEGVLKLRPQDRISIPKLL